MKIIYKTWRPSGTTEVSVEDAIRGSLKPLYDEGTIGRLQEQIDNQTEAFAKLVAGLAERGLHSDVIKSMLSYRYEVED